MGRPSKFTEPRKEQILAVLKVGGSRETAANIAGVAYETLRVWLKRGEEVDDPDSAYTQFREEVLAAEAAPRFKALMSFDKALTDRPDLAWKLIERKEPGYAPPQPGKPASSPQVQINLSLTGSSDPLPAWIQGSVVEAPDSTPVLPSGDTPVEDGEES